MHDHDKEKLLCRFLDGRLTGAEEHSLAVELRRDPELLARLRDEREIAGLLRQIPVTGEEFLRSFEERKLADRDSNAFAEELARRKDLADRRQYFGWRTVLLPAASLAVVAGVWWFARSGSVNQGSVLETGKGQTIALRFDGEETLVEMAENTKLRVVDGSVVTGAMVNVELVKSGPEKVIQLESGSIKVSVAKQTGGRAFLVRSAQAEIRVVGTKFSVGVGVGDGKTRVDVQEGAVNVRSRSGYASVNVTPGMRANVNDGKCIELSGSAVKFVRECSVPELQGDTMGLAFDGELLWVSVEKAEIYGVDPATMEVRRKLDLSDKYRRLFSMAWGDGALWAVATRRQGDGVLARISLPDGAVRDSVLPPDTAIGTAVAYGNGSVWIGRNYPNECVILRLDPESGKELGRIRAKGGRYATLSFLDGGLWFVAGSHSGEMIRIGTETGSELIRAPFVWEGRGIVEFAEADDSGRFWTLARSFNRLMQFEACFARKAGSSTVPRQ